MTKLVWDQVGERFYELGVRNGVLYPAAGSGYGEGVAWNGLTSVKEKPTGAEIKEVWANDHVYLNMMSSEKFEATIEAYTYPEEFDPCIGRAELAPGVIVTQQDHKQFGMSYRSSIGNDVDGNEHAYQIHLVYGAKATPSETSRDTINDDPEAVAFSWEVKTSPIEVPGMKPCAHFVIDSRKVSPEHMAQLEAMLYGSDGDIASEPRLPTPAELVTIFGTEVAQG